MRAAQERRTPMPGAVLGCGAMTDLLGIGAVLVLTLLLGAVVLPTAVWVAVRVAMLLGLS